MGRFVKFTVSVLLVMATLVVAQPARALPLGPLAIAFGLDLIRNRASQPVESSSVGAPSLSVNVHWDDGGRDLIIGGANLGAQGLVVSAGSVLEIEPQLPVKPNISDMRAITFYSMRAGFPNLALVRPEFKKDLLRELGLEEGKERERSHETHRRSPWSREPHHVSRSYSDDRRPSEVLRLRDWDIIEVDDYLGWLIWLDTRELNGYYTPAVDFFFRNGSVPAGFLNLCRRARSDSIRSITNIAVVRAEEVEAGLNSPAVQRALEYFSGGQCYVPPLVQPTYRVTNPEVAAMMAEGQQTGQQPPAAQSPMMYQPQAGYLPVPPSYGDVPPWPSEGRERPESRLPAMPGTPPEESAEYWEQQVPLPAAEEPTVRDGASLILAELDALRREASYFNYTGDPLRQGFYRARVSSECPHNQARLHQPVDIFFVKRDGTLLQQWAIDVKFTRGGQSWERSFSVEKGILVLTGVEPNDRLSISFGGHVIWDGQMPGPSQGLWLPVLLDK